MLACATTSDLTQAWRLHHLSKFEEVTGKPVAFFYWDCYHLFAMGQIDPSTEASARRFLALIQPQYKVAGAILYGSRARGTHRSDSDVDLAILLWGARGRALPTTLAMADVAYDVLLETGINISPLPIWLEDWQHPEQFSNPTLLHNIDREGVRL